VQKMSSVIFDPINRPQARSNGLPAGIVRRSNALERSPVLEYVSVVGNGNWLLKFRDNRGKFYSLFVLVRFSRLRNGSSILHSRP